MVSYNHSSILSITSHPEHCILSGLTFDSTGLLVPQAGHSILGDLFFLPLSLFDLGDTSEIGNTNKILEATIALSLIHI